MAYTTFLPGSEKGWRILANLKKPIHCILKRLNTYLEISNLQMESPISINSVIDIMIRFCRLIWQMHTYMWQYTVIIAGFLGNDFGQAILTV